MTTKKNTDHSDKPKEVNEPLASYKNSGITFSTLETQGDILLKNSMEKSPAERLMMMNILNAYAYKNITGEKLLFKNARLTFSSYEYIP